MSTNLKKTKSLNLQPETVKKKSSKPGKPLKTIGWREKIDFPEFGLKNVAAKVDTGAKTSVIHCSHIEKIKRYRKTYVKFILLDESHPDYTGKEHIFPYHSERKVKNSFGNEENRFIILTKMRMFGRSFNVEISLRDRSNMEYPMLLGRRTIRNRFKVDVAKSNLSYKYKQKKLKNLKGKA